MLICDDCDGNEVDEEVVDLGEPWFSARNLVGENRPYQPSGHCEEVEGMISGSFGKDLEA